MSPSIQGLTQQLQDAIRAARPGLVRVYVLVAEYADGSHRTEVVQAGAEGDQPVPVATQATPEQPDEQPDLPPRRPDETPVSYVQRLRRTRGRIELKASRWSELTGLAVAELERAMVLPRVGEPALPWRTKTEGRGHGAKLVSAEAMAAYLAAADAVERGDIAPPPWWHSVRAGSRKAT